MALQIRNAACVLGTVSNRDALEEIYYIQLIFLILYIIAASEKAGIVAGMSSSLAVSFCYWSTGIVAGMGFPTFVADHECVLLPPTWWYTWHLIDDEDPWYLIEEKRTKKKREQKILT